MAYDNRRRERSWWPALDYFTRVLPQALMTSAAQQVEPAEPQGPAATPPTAAQVNRYTRAARTDEAGLTVGVTVGVSSQARADDRWLELQRRRFRYCQAQDNPIAPIALAEEVPLSANYDLAWALPYLPVLLPVLAHVAANRARFAWQQLRGRFDRFTAYQQMFEGVLSGRGDIPFPAVAEDYGEDAAFARQRLDGPNPLLIARVPDRAWISARMEDYSDEAFAATTGHALSAELAAGHVYACDYVLLQESLKPAAARDSRAPPCWRSVRISCANSTGSDPG